MIHRALRQLLACFFALSLAACATSQPFASAANDAPEQTTNVQTQAAIMEAAEAAQPLPAAPPERVMSPAAKALLSQAQSQLGAGHDALAAGTLERALRIEPDNPLIWIELAKLRHLEGNAAQAENLARKALALAQGDPRAQAAAWRVIADSYRARGRNPDAQEAEARAATLAGN